ncbi:MAG: hypothetical protein ACJ77Y_09265, partial [Chloroflexota bacterium]
AGRLDLAWVQAFRIPAGGERFVGQVTQALSAVAPIIGVWAWRGSTGRGTLRSDDPMRVQREVSAAIRRVRRVRRVRRERQVFLVPTTVTPSTAG